MTTEEAIEYWEQFNAEIDDLYDTCSDAERGILEKQREAVELTISTFRAQRKQTPCSCCGYGGKHLDAPPCTTCPAHPKGKPPNAPLTLDELKTMDGEPVWIVEYPDWGHWELSVDAEDYVADRDPEFYGMKHDDPAGRYGLHKLGWLAYRRKPEEGTV